MESATMIMGAGAPLDLTLPKDVIWPMVQGHNLLLQ